MTERFAYTTGTISVEAGGAVVTGTGTAWGGRDREGAQIWVQPDDAPPFRVGTVAAVEPRGVYGHTELPLLSPWNGEAIEDAAYELLDGAAIANGATQAAIYARFAAHLEQNMGLVGNMADAIDFALVPNNTLFVDPTTRTIYQWRNGVLAQVFSVGLAFSPRGAWSAGASPGYDTNDLVEHDGRVYVSNEDGNNGNEPPTTAPYSDSHWTWLPLPSGPGDKYTLAIWTPGRPRDGELMLRHEFEETVTFPADLSGSRASAGTASTDEAVITLKKNGTPVATVTFDSSASGAYAADDPVTFTPGDVLEVFGPTPRDDTLADVSLTLAGERA